LTDDDVEYRFYRLCVSGILSFDRSNTHRHRLVGADESSVGHMLTKEQEEQAKPRLEAEKNRTEATSILS